MGVMTEVAYAADGFTLDDLDAMPDDGRCYELIDGMLLVSPGPVPRHQLAVSRLLVALATAKPPGVEILPAPLDFRPGGARSLQPDLMVLRRDELGETVIEIPPMLVVETLSPSTRLKDLSLKRAVYEESGIASYWIVDPVAPSLRVLELVDGSYAERAMVTGTDVWHADVPFTVSVCPADLVS